MAGAGLPSNASRKPFSQSKYSRSNAGAVRSVASKTQATDKRATSNPSASNASDVYQVSLRYENVGWLDEAATFADLQAAVAFAETERSQLKAAAENTDQPQRIVEVKITQVSPQLPLSRH